MIKGKITGFSGGKFTITIGEGARQRKMTFSADEVDTVEFDPASAASTANTNVASNNGSTEPPRRTTVPKVITTDNTGTTRPQPTPQNVPSNTTVASNNTNSAPVIVEEEPTPPSVPETTPRASSVKPIELNVNVLADETSNGWTNSGWIVKKGQRIKVIASGEVTLGKGNTSSPSGRYDLEDEGKLMPAVATGALLAVIGDDNNEFVYIGAEREFVAKRDGALFLGVNENNLSDNSGSYTVKIEIYP